MNMTRNSYLFDYFLNNHTKIIHYNLLFFNLAEIFNLLALLFYINYLINILPYGSNQYPPSYRGRHFFRRMGLNWV